MEIETVSGIIAFSSDGMVGKVSKIKEAIMEMVSMLISVTLLRFPMF